MKMSPMPSFTGQLEQDRSGSLCAVLYREQAVLAREPVGSLRHGKRRLADLLLTAAEQFSPQPSRLDFPQLADRRLTDPRSVALAA